MRIADVCTRIEDALCVAALYRCLVRRLTFDPGFNADIEVIDRAIAEENIWRAQRYGTAESVVVRGGNSLQPIDAAVEGLLALLDEDVAILDCANEVFRARAILERGSSADAQLEIYRTALSAGRTRMQALTEVIDWIRRTTADLRI